MGLEWPMRVKSSTIRSVLSGAAGALVVLGAAFVIFQRLGPRPITVSVGEFPEQFVYVRSDDDVVNGGVMFAPPKSSARPLAVLWIHGWGANFYSPTYVMIGRALAERRLTTISGNTRMHDIANVQQYRRGKRIRGGGYWGVPSEQVRDIAAWMDFAEQQGFAKIVLVGHSAGWAAVRAYLAERRDPRVAGGVLASGQVRPGSGATDQELIAQANRFVRDGRSDDLLRLPNRSFPSFISAATFLDDLSTPRHVLDFFGVQHENPAVARVSCPLLAFFGTRDDVGTEAELQVLKSSVERQKSGPRSVTVAMIQNADHMYTGEEQQVAQVISDWVDRVVLAPAATR
jgi:pimeloyl-ACP methyl ester carboxylesterase